MSTTPTGQKFKLVKIPVYTDFGAVQVTMVDDVETLQGMLIDCSKNSHQLIARLKKARRQRSELATRVTQLESELKYIAACLRATDE